MIETGMILIPILITDVINPVLFGFMVYAAGTHRPVLHSSLILLGHTLAYFTAGIILALGLNQLTDRLANPQQIDYFIGLIIGILLIWVAISSRKKTQHQQNEISDGLTPLKALGLGGVVNFVGIPFALPYFAALDQILKSDLAVTESLTVLLVYNFIYALPFLVVPSIVKILGEGSQVFLERINDVLERVSSFLIPVLLLLVGLALVSDAISYFVRDEGLF